MKQKGIKIKHLIGLFVTIAMIVIVVAQIIISSQEYKETLIEDRLEQNYNYAHNVANATDLLMRNMDQNIEKLAAMIGEGEFTQADLDDWLAANDYFFNSLFTTDEYGVIQLMSPLQLESNPNQVQPGTQIVSDLMKNTLKEQKPFISDPYFAQTGMLMLLVSHPVFDQEGVYRGVIDGTIYLEGDSSLQTLLNRHDFLSHSTVFVVDRTGKIVYHPHVNRTNEDISDHPVIQDIMAGKSGSSEVTNRFGEEYFTGYGVIDEWNWGVIVQTPIDIIDEPLQELRKQMIIQSIPVATILIIVGLFISYLIGRPLSRLSRYSREAITTAKVKPYKFQYKSAIYEVNELKEDLQKHINRLNREIELDGLTQLYNRATFDLKIKELIKENRKFSLILLDIDHFKKVNDTFGHVIGDQVIINLALLMKERRKENELFYRYGGEEFAILLEGRDSEYAFNYAEELRETVEEVTSETDYPIRISLGITSYRGIIQNLNANVIISQADEALYESKQNGRNQTSVYINYK